MATALVPTTPRIPTFLYFIPFHPVHLTLALSTIPSRLIDLISSVLHTAGCVQYGSVSAETPDTAHLSDPPLPTASSSELRDLSLTPSSIRSARITIIHPQLRDLILPLDRGNVLYPKGTTLEQQQWVDEDYEEGVKVGFAIFRLVKRTPEI
jgi:hypothetical protein